MAGFVDRVAAALGLGSDAGKKGFCTQIGNDWFTWFGTRPSKSRLNFLDLLRADHTDYVLNDAAYGYMRRHDLSAPAIALLMARTRTRFNPPDGLDVDPAAVRQ